MPLPVYIDRVSVTVMIQNECKKTSKVYISPFGNGLKSVLQKGLDYINYDGIITKHTRVFIKPNFTYPFYKEGVTTSPELLTALFEILTKKTDTIIMGESDGGNNSFTADEAFEGHNMFRICREYGLELVNLSTLPSQIVREKIAGKVVEVELPKLLLNKVDCFISVPVFKVHAMTTLSLSIKNLWGCVPDSMRLLKHQNIDYKLALIARVVKPRIVVIDGTYALDKNGPMFGEPVKMGLLLVAENAVDADEMGARIMETPLQKVKHIVIAKKAGLGSKEIDIQTNAGWQKCRRKFTVKRTIVQQFAYLAFISDIIAKIVYASPFTPLVYKIVEFLRTREEKRTAGEISVKYKIRGY
jgi:uncharacterized protein (DUF362 family)